MVRPEPPEALIAKVNADEVPPPGVGVNTVTCAEPAEATSAIVIAACKLVPDT